MDMMASNFGLISPCMKIRKKENNRVNGGGKGGANPRAKVSSEALIALYQGSGAFFREYSLR